MHTERIVIRMRSVTRTVIGFQSGVNAIHTVQRGHIIRLLLLLLILL